MCIVNRTLTSQNIVTFCFIFQAAALFENHNVEMIHITHIFIFVLLHYLYLYLYIYMEWNGPLQSIYKKKITQQMPIQNHRRVNMSCTVTRWSSALIIFYY